jgi:hypothetical protein
MSSLRKLGDDEQSVALIYTALLGLGVDGLRNYHWHY